jgi:hypothetical protein
LQVISNNDKVITTDFLSDKRSGKEFPMLNAIKVSLSRKEIIGAVKSMNKRDRDDFLEELLATTSPEYLESIKDARADYKAGRVKTHDEVFGH